MINKLIIVILSAVVFAAAGCSNEGYTTGGSERSKTLSGSLPSLLNVKATVENSDSVEMESPDDARLGFSSVSDSICCIYIAVWTNIDEELHLLINFNTEEVKLKGEPYNIQIHDKVKARAHLLQDGVNENAEVIISGWIREKIHTREPAPIYYDCDIQLEYNDGEKIYTVRLFDPEMKP